VKTKKDKTYSYNHTKERALDRYGIELTPQIYDEWKRLCVWENRIQIDRSNKQQTYVIQWQGKSITVVTTLENNTAKEEYIKTVLPEGTKLMFASSEKIRGQWITYGNQRNC
jgi:hypothetical protein